MQKKDIEPVLADFETEYERSVIHSKIVIDTSVATVEESVDEMRQALQPHSDDRGPAEDGRAGGG